MKKSHIPAFNREFNEIGTMNIEGMSQEEIEKLCSELQDYADKITATFDSILSEPDLEPSGENFSRLSLQSRADWIIHYAMLVSEASIEGIHKVLEYSLNKTLKEKLSNKREEKSLFTKKDTANSINKTLTEHGAAIEEPTTKEPCLLVIVTSRDGNGRYALESRHGRKRSGSYAAISELLPIRIIKDVERTPKPKP